MPSPIPGPIPIASATQQGQVSIAAQDFGGVKTFEQGAIVSLYDIRNTLYAGGAVSAADTVTASLAVSSARPAILATIGAWTQVGSNTQFQAAGPAGGVDLGTGNYYVDAPIVCPRMLWMYGDGPQYANLAIGPGTPATPDLVQGFAGPVLYLGGINPGVTAGNGFPSYGAPLVGGTGRSMVMTTFNPLSSPIFYPPTIILDDSWAWSCFLMWFASELSLQGWAKPTAAFPAVQQRSIIGSQSFSSFSEASAIKLYCTSDGTSVFFNAALTTAVTGYKLITSSAVAVNSVNNLQIDYDGTHLDFFLNGVSQGHVPMTGRVVKNPLDCASLGDSGNEIQGFNTYQFTGEVDSFRLSNVARNPGTGSFTPPTSKYAWDSNTLWLCNFDQPDPTPQSPFFRAQSVVTTVSNYGLTFGPPSPTTAAQTPGPIGGPNPHYCVFGGWTNIFMEYFGASNCTFENFQVIGSNSGSGIRGYSASHCNFNNVWTAYTNAWGIQLIDGFSFFSGIQNCAALQSFQVGIGFLNELGSINLFGNGNGVDFFLPGGDFSSCQSAASWNSYLPFVFGGFGGEFDPIKVSSCGIDDEGSFPYQIAGALVLGTSQVTFYNNGWNVSAGMAGAPAVLYEIAPDAGAVHISDAFFPGAGGPCISTVGKRPVINSGTPNLPPIQAISCENYGNPISDIPGLVSEFKLGALTTQRGISTTGTVRNNLSGTFDIMFGFSSGGPVFPTPEPDVRYQANVYYLGFSGSSPAAGSTLPGQITNLVNDDGTSPGFIMDQGVMQTGTCTTHWGYDIVGVPGAALADDYLPSVPSTLVNPLVTAQPTSFPWFVGATIVPASGNALAFDNSLGNQVIVTAGTPSTNYWQLRLGTGYQAQVDIGANCTGLACDSFVSNGQLYGIMNPGPHNIVFGIDNNVPTLGGFGTSVIYVDGALGVFFLGTNNQSAGTQQTPIHIGETPGATEPLTSAAVRRVRVDTSLGQVVYHEQDQGPQTDSQGAFFGDQMTLGALAATTAGGFATQIANIRFATSYYWLAAKSQGTFLGDVLPNFWQQWGGNQDSFSGMCLMAGFEDLLNGVSAASIWAGMQLMMNGTPATATFAPPVQTDQAEAFFVPQFTGTSTCVINGISINCVAGIDGVATVTALIALLQANSTLNALATYTLTPNTSPGQPNAYLTATAKPSSPGFLGNAITTSTNGVGGAFWYPGTTFFNGSNGTLTIEGVLFNAYFDTDADTTVNDLIALINASGPTAALVTPSLVSHQLLLTAVDSGSDGNDITVATNNALGCSLAIANATSGTLLGGVNGAVQNGIDPIIFCTVPPFGQSPGYTSGKDTQRNTLNASIRGFSAAGVTIADVDILLRDPAAHQNMLAAYLSADNTNPNDAGHTALYVFLAPLLPGGSGTPPSALSYATNPASYAHGSPISSNNPTVTGTPTQYVVSPGLPAGLTLNASTGHITGNPTTATPMATYTVMASNASGSTTAALVISIT